MLEFIVSSHVYRIYLERKEKSEKQKSWDRLTMNEDIFYANVITIINVNNFTQNNNNV